MDDSTVSVGRKSAADPRLFGKTQLVSVDSMRVLVTGGDPVFLGNNLCRTLIQQGHEPVAVVRSVSDLRSLDGLAVEIVTVDFEDSNDLAVAMDSVDAVVHAAALIHLGWTKLDASRKVNVDTTIRIAKIARTKNIRMIFVSSVDALGKASPDNIGTEERLDPAQARQQLCGFQT